MSKTTRRSRAALILLCLALLCLAAVGWLRAERVAVRRQVPGVVCWGDSLNYRTGCLMV